MLLLASSASAFDLKTNVIDFEFNLKSHQSTAMPVVGLNVNKLCTKYLGQCKEGEVCVRQEITKINEKDPDYIKIKDDKPKGWNTQVCMKRDGDKPTWTTFNDEFEYEMTYTVIPQESLNAEFVKFADKEVQAAGYKDFKDFLTYAEAEQQKDKKKYDDFQKAMEDMSPEELIRFEHNMKLLSKHVIQDESAMTDMTKLYNENMAKVQKVIENSKEEWEELKKKVSTGEAEKATLQSNLERLTEIVTKLKTDKTTKEDIANMQKYVEENKHLIADAQEKAKNAADAQNLVIPGLNDQKQAGTATANSAKTLAASAATAAAVSFALF